MASCSDRCCLYETQQVIKRRVVPSAIALVVAAVVAFLTISFAVNPHVKTNVEDARLNTFDYFAVDGGGNTASFFSYNLSVALTIRNPNKAIGIKHTKPLLAVIAFHDRRLQHNSGIVVVDEGYEQRPGKAKQIILPFDGKISSDLLGAAAADDFKRQNATGLFEVELRLSGEITNHPFVIPRKHELGTSCPLSLQLAPPGPEVVVFHEVICKPVKPDKIYF